MDEKTIKKMKAEYEAQCRETERLARKAMLTLLTREAKGQVIH
jgi:hypothetical protein